MSLDRETVKKWLKVNTRDKILRKMDPIDSLYFDVSVARHQLEEGDHTKALEWLDPNHALGELKKSVNAKLLTPKEFDKVGEAIIKILDAVKAERTTEAHAIIVSLQNNLAEKAYTTFRDLDPVMQEKKVAEWKALGYPQELIDNTLKLADKYIKAMAK